MSEDNIEKLNLIYPEQDETLNAFVQETLATFNDSIESYAKAASIITIPNFRRNKITGFTYDVDPILKASATESIKNILSIVAIKGYNVGLQSASEKTE